VPDEGALKPHLSWSQVQMFSMCGERYRRRYIQGEIIPPGIACMVGRATHSGIEANLRAKLATGSLLPTDAVSAAARDALNSAIDKDGVELTEEEQGRGLSAVRGEAVDAAVALSILHHDVLAPQITPAHIERPFRLLLGGFSHDLVGYLDLQETDGCVRDTKTAARSPSVGSADASEQLTCYALARKVLDGAIPPRLTLDVLVKTKTPKAIVQETMRTDADFRPFLQRVAITGRMLNAGLFPPATLGSWCCSPKWCGYWHTCPYAHGRVVSGPGPKTKQVFRTSELGLTLDVKASEDVTDLLAGMAHEDIPDIG
jgi:hypothetical protein